MNPNRGAMWGSHTDERQGSSNQVIVDLSVGLLEIKKDIWKQRLENFEKLLGRYMIYIIDVTVIVRRLIDLGTKYIGRG